MSGLYVTVQSPTTTAGRHRRMLRVPAKDTGLAGLPLASFDTDRIWCAIVALAGEVTA